MISGCFGAKPRNQSTHRFDFLSTRSLYQNTCPLYTSCSCEQWNTSQGASHTHLATSIEGTSLIRLLSANRKRGDMSCDLTLGVRVHLLSFVFKNMVTGAVARVSYVLRLTSTQKFSKVCTEYPVYSHRFVILQYAL